MVRVRARAREWNYFCFFFLCVKVTKNFVLCGVLILYFGACNVRVIIVFWNVYCFLCAHMPYICFMIYKCCTLCIGSDF